MHEKYTNNTSIAEMLVLLVCFSTENTGESDNYKKIPGIAKNGRRLSLNKLSFEKTKQMAQY